ncbi:MAG: tetratricopeptide repeat protein [Lentisphaeria bacterium]|nr:tetratricopeptide repeat protein [Lentisphaeria bacterium]
MFNFGKTIILSAILLSVLAVNAVTPGLAAKRRHDYFEAVRLLNKERSNFAANSLEYQNYTFEIVESLIGSGDFAAAAKELLAIRSLVDTSAANKLHFEILKNLVTANTAESEKRSAIDKIIKIFENESELSQDSRLLIVNFTVPLLSQEADYKTALKLIRDLNLTELDENYDNLTLEYCKLLIFDGQFDEAEKLIQNFSFATIADSENLKQDFSLLLNSYRKNIEFYLKNRPSIIRQNSIIHQADLKMAENLTENAPKSDELYQALKFAVSSIDESQAIEYKNSLIKLIDFELDNGKDGNALKNIELFTAKYPDANEYVPLMNKKIAVYRKNNDSKNILATFEAIINNEQLAISDRMAAAELAAELYLQNNDSEHALSLYDFMLKNSSSDEETAKVNLLIGQYYFQSNNFYLAANYLTKIGKSSSYFKNALLMTIQCYFKLENYKDLEKAIENFHSAFKSDKNVTVTELNTVKFFTAEMYEKNEKKSEAIKLYEELVILNQEDCLYVPEAILNLGEIYFGANSYDKAAEQFLNFAKNYPDDANADKALYRAVYAYYLAEKIEETIQAVKLMSEKYPKSPYTIKALFHLADHYRISNEFEKAAETLAELELLLHQDDLNTKAMIAYNRAVIYNENKRYSKALEELNSLIEKYPQSSMLSDCYFLMGVIYSEIGENLQSLEAFQKASEKNNKPLFITVCKGKMADNYFILYSKRNEKEYLEAGIKLYEELAENRDNDFFVRTQSYYKLGRSLEAAGEYQEALNAYNNAIYEALSVLDRNGKTIPPIWLNKCGANAIKLNLNHGGRNAKNNAKIILERLKELNQTIPAELREFEELLK